MELPLASCIMPTANRPNFVPRAIDNFLRQDYSNAELIIIDDGIESCVTVIPDHPKIRYYYSKPLGTIGIKRNIACEKSKGDYIIHWDDDDWYGPDWISKELKALQSPGVDITGLNKIRFFVASLTRNFVFEDNDENKKWVCGATLAYKKAIWQNYHFSNLHIGEDADFLFNSGGKLGINDNVDGYLAVLHGANTSIQYLEQTTMEWTD